jgi:hypothetical protein
MTARTVSATVAIAAVATGLLAGCAASHPGFDTLRADPLVTAKVSGLTDTQLYGQIEFTALSKHEPATITRLLRTTTRKVTATDLAMAADQAKTDGWQVTPASNNTWTGTKTIAGAPTLLRIRRNFSDGDRVLVAVILTATR